MPTTIKHTNNNNNVKLTTIWHSNISSILGAVILILLWQGCHHHHVAAASAAAAKNGYYGNQEDLQEVNVTCIPFDTQFTCDCHNVERHLFLPHLIGSAFQMEIRNCKSLTINSNALEETQGLRKITFKNVENLVLNKYALSFPLYSSSTPLIIAFEKVKVKLIDSHAINGQIEEITFVDSSIETINPFGFTILKSNALLLKMENVQINRIESQAFKKFVVEKIDLQNCVFLSNVPSKAFYDVEVSHLLLLNNLRFKEVHSRAFSFKLISKLIIANNYFESVDAEWLEVYIKESSIIRDNYFGNTSQIAFKGIMVHRDYVGSEKLELRFSNNTIHFPHNVQPLDFNEKFALNLKQLNYDNSYSCHEIDYEQKPPKAKEKFFQNFKDFIYFKQNHNTKSHDEYRVLSKIIDTDCQQHSYWLYIIIGVVSLIIVIAIIVIVVCLYMAKKRKAKRKMDIIQPEPRTYKETQIVYQIENAGLLKTDF
ncbi:uncharacterized protein LOC111675319 isoform X1 [Lucilia cuprina]|uniref:uncharacterized protein LOC111675319 isoform X1 n=1 Tax=Lucilia cuprina TaxID=7375 RepID=UPI001F05BD0D|nr:uncharacterized protein LOC111675319 isoform X1 [Lucilia cuprina]